MRIAIVGTGYVGLVTGAIFANRGNEVICIDKNNEIISSLNVGRIHIFEPGLEDLVQDSVSKGNLNFTTDLSSAVGNSETIFLAVGTPSNQDGSFNTTYFLNAASDVAEALRGAKGFRVVVGKSTVPQGTYQKVMETLEKTLGKTVNWAYVSNPETLAEGTAVRDFERPDRIILGTESDQAFEVMRQLYHPFIRKGGDRLIVRGSPGDAELSKLAANTLLATRIAAINEVARIADVTPGVDMEIVRQMIGADSRIGLEYLFPGPGYGGSCFPKDVKGMVAQSETHGYAPLLLGTVNGSNESHKSYLGERILELLGKNTDLSIGVWGLTFKPQTDDMRDAASIPILTRLIKNGIRVKAYDPQDRRAREIFKDRVEFFEEQYEVTREVDALLLLTEWPQFDVPNYGLLKRQMKGRDLLDLRNRWEPRVANAHGFNYFGIGRNYPFSS
jgi:UDPglucose 6-dehydrogenase